MFFTSFSRFFAVGSLLFPSVCARKRRRTAVIVTAGFHTDKVNGYSGAIA